jgi:hypothetical protein
MYLIANAATYALDPLMDQPETTAKKRYRQNFPRTRSRFLPSLASVNAFHQTQEDSANNRRIQQTTGGFDQTIGGFDTISGTITVPSTKFTKP